MPVFKSYKHYGVCGNCDEVVIDKVSKTKVREEQLRCGCCGYDSYTYQVTQVKKVQKVKCLECRGTGEKMYKVYGLQPCSKCGGKGEIHAKDKNIAKKEDLLDLLANL